MGGLLREVGREEGGREEVDSVWFSLKSFQ